MKRIFLLGFLLAVSCGGDSGNSDDFSREDEDKPEPETLQKVYRADLKAVNPTINNRVQGQVVIRLEDETFEVNVAATNVSAAKHPQAVRTGKSCPTMENDANRDGVIDIREATTASGEVFIPLDKDLDRIENDNGEYPLGGIVGSYVYQEKTTRQQLVDELGPEASLFFEDRVVLILGTD